MVLACAAGPSGGKRSRKKETIMSTTTNFWELLQQRQDELTKSGRAVADYLVHHADEAQYLSISSLARECKVAEATVFRFCRALGFEGYHEMRISLEKKISSRRRRIPVRIRSIHTLIKKPTPAPTVISSTVLLI